MCRRSTVKNAFASTLCFVKVLRDIIWSKRALSDCFLCIPFIFSGSPDEVPNMRNSNLEIRIVDSSCRCAISKWNMSLNLNVKFNTFIKDKEATRACFVQSNWKQ